jgi:hypothetical protein
MGGRKRNNQRKPHEERRFRVRGVRLDPPEMRKLGKALLGLAQAEVARLAEIVDEDRATGQANPPAREDLGDG